MNCGESTLPNAANAATAGKRREREAAHVADGGARPA